MAVRQLREAEDPFQNRSLATNEIAPERAAEEARVEIQSAIIIARKFPRNEQAAYQKLMHACERTTFAEDAQYSFPRFSSDENKQVDITGPSVRLAREAGRIWGNIRWGFSIVTDSEESRTIEGFAYDLETNARPAYQDTFTKMGYTKGGGWKPLNERGLRETTARRGAFLIRNAILNLIPSDFVDDAMAKVEATLASEVRKDPDAEKKKIIAAFDSIGVPVAELEEFIGGPLASASPAQIKKLRGIYKSIDDGNSTWAEYSKKKEPINDPKSKTTAPAATTNITKPAAEVKEEKPLLKPEQLNLLRQSVSKKSWPADLYGQLLKSFGFESEAEITEAKLPAVLEAAIQGPQKFNPELKLIPTEPAKEQPKSEPAPAGNGNGDSGKADKLSDAQKGKIWQVARAKRWAKGSGAPDDPLHQFLEKALKIDSVTKVPAREVDRVLEALDKGPEALGFKPVD